jgi:hypothetical protein
MKTLRLSILSLLLPFLSFLLSACAHHAPVPPLDLNSATPAISARYVTERQHNDQHDGHVEHEGHEEVEDFQNEWIFHRNAQRIEVHVPAQQTGEVWLRDGKTVFYQKLFHADKKIVEYQMEDLSGLNVAVNWRTNELMIDPAILKQLSITGEDWIDGHPALELSGMVDAIDYDVVWLVDLNLPHSIEKRDADGNHERTKMLGLETSPMPDSAHYESIDYADLGDRERDPFVMKIQDHLIGGHRH